MVKMVLEALKVIQVTLVAKDKMVKMVHEENKVPTVD